MSLSVLLLAHSVMPSGRVIFTLVTLDRPEKNVSQAKVGTVISD